MDPKEPKLLKRFNGDQVTYDVDYLLNNLSREIWLLENYRRWRDSERNETWQGYHGHCIAPEGTFQKIGEDEKEGE